MLARSLLSLVVLTACSPSHGPAAQPTYSPELRERAKYYYSEGRTNYDLGNFDKAVENFKKAYEELPDGAFLFNIAQAYRQLQDCKNALFFYKRFLSVKDAPAATKTEVEGHIEVLEQCVKDQASPPAQQVTAGASPVLVRTSAPVSNVDVEAVRDPPGWKITVQNKRQESISILWDESSFVSSSGTSMGRLLRGNTRRRDTALPQPASPVAPNAKATEWFVPQFVADMGSLASPGLPLNTSDDPARIVLVLDSSEGKLQWIGEVVLASGGPSDHQVKQSD